MSRIEYDKNLSAGETADLSTPLRRDVPQDISVLTILLGFLAGFNSRRLRLLPPDEHHIAARAGLTVICAFLFEWFACTAALFIAFADDTEIRAILVAGAALIAFMITLIDQAILHAHWYQAGAEEAWRRGFEADAPPIAGFFRKFLMASFRVGMSGVLALCLAIFLLLAILRTDIDRVIRLDFMSDNAALAARVEARVDAEIRKAAADAQGAADNLVQLRSALQSKQLEATAAQEAARKAREARITKLQSYRDEQRAEAAARQRDAINEEYGTKESDRQSGVPGKKRRYFSAQNLAALATESANAADQEIKRLKAESDATSPALLATIEDLKHDVVARDGIMVRLVEHHDRLVAARNKQIKDEIEVDPAYKPVAQGLMARLKALNELEQDSSLFPIIIGIKALLMLVEMGAVIVNVLLVGPSLYAVTTALDFETATSGKIADSEALLAVIAERLSAARAKRDASFERRERRRTDLRVASKARDWLRAELSEDPENRRGA